MQKYPILVIVDVQPEYEEGSETILHKVLDKINNTEQRIICFYVGSQSGCDSKEDVMTYYLKNGIDEDKLNKIHFIEKDFGFLREWMDRGIKEEIIIKSLAYMKENKMSSSDKFSIEEWQNIAEGESSKKIFENKPIEYPYFHHKVLEKPEINNIELIGGGRFECLLEIDLYLKSLKKDTFINEDLCYGTYRPDHKKKIKTKKL